MGVKPIVGTFGSLCRFAWLSTFVWLLFGCTNDKSLTSDGSAGSGALPLLQCSAGEGGGTTATVGQRCALTHRVGLIEVTERGGSPGSNYKARAVVFDRPNPWYGDYTLSTDTCGFHQFKPEAACTSCDDEQVCAQDGNCVPAPVYATGLSLTLATGGQQQTFTSHSVYEYAGGDVTLPGRTFAATVSWAGCSVSLPETTIPDELADLVGTVSGSSYDKPTALDLSWTPPSNGAQVYTLIPINHHAAGPTFTECTVDAAVGALHVDQAMLEPLAVITGLEFQSAEHVRFAAANTEVGCIEFRLWWSRHPQLTYEWYTH